MGRPQQPELVIEPQLPAGDLGDLREFADTEHVRLPRNACRSLHHAIAFGDDDAMRAPS